MVLIDLSKGPIIQIARNPVLARASTWAKYGIKPKKFFVFKRPVPWALDKGKLSPAQRAVNAEFARIAGAMKGRKPWEVAATIAKQMKGRVFKKEKVPVPAPAYPIPT